MDEGNYSKAGLFRYLKEMTVQGLLNEHTAAGFRAAASKLLEDLADSDDVRGVDVETAAIKYHNKHTGEISTASLKTYSRRVKRLLRDFEKHVTDPLGFKPRSRALSKAGTEKARARFEAVRAVGQEVVGAVAEVSRTVSSILSPEASLVLPYPLRSNFTAQVVVPRNINVDEARRLCAFIMTLASDFKPVGPIGLPDEAKETAEA